MKKPTATKFLALALTLLPVFSWAAGLETEYYGTTVLLVDSEKGMIAVQGEDEKTGQAFKKSLAIKLADVYVTNPLNHYLELSQVAAGDMVDLYCTVDDEGNETVYEIMDYNKFEER